MFGEKLSHYVDLPRWWIGAPVTEIYSASAPNVVPYYRVHDNENVIYKFENGAVSSLSFVMYVAQSAGGDPLQTSDKKENGGVELTYLITGTRGAAATNVVERSLRRWEFGDSPTRMTSTLAETLTWQPEEDTRYYHDSYTQNEDIVRRVVNGLPPAIAPRDALETMRLCFAADLSAETGRVVRLDELS